MGEAGFERAPGRWGPQWGVMFSDRSVAARWNGATQRERALAELRAVQERAAGAGRGSDRCNQVYLVWRASEADIWRVDPEWAEDFLEA